MDSNQSKPKNIIFITNKWGPAHGGINSFNTDFCKALADVVSDGYQVVCAVEKATDEDIKDAGNVRLIPLDSELNPNCVRIINDMIQQEQGQIVLWAGHDAISGHISNKAKELYKNKSVVFQHMAPWLYQAFKSHSGNKAHEKDMDQRAIAEGCDQIFTVGPLLYDHAVQLCDNEDKVEMVIPGLQKKERKKTSKNRFNGITFGRLNEKDDKIKNGVLAATAFFKAAQELFSPDDHAKIIFTLLGLSKEDKEYKQEFNKLQKLCTKETKGRVVLNPLSYLEDKDAIDARLLEQDLCMMLSTHEGFGLVGWEAIGAGIPLIVSKNSGLYQFVDEHHRELTGFLRSVNVYDDKTSIVKVVVGEIKYIKNNQNKAFEDAEKLCDGLGEYTWERAAREFVKICGIPLKKVVKAKKKDTESSFKTQDIDAKIKTEIIGILKNKKFVQLTEVLFEELPEDGKTGVDIDKVGSLARYLLDCSSHFDVLIMLHKAVKRCFGDIVEASEKEIFRAALDIFGWLVIRHVDPKWVEENRTVIFESRKTPGIELPVVTHAGAEILTSRTKVVKAGFVKASADTIMGEHSLIKKKVVLQEFGWVDDDKVLSFKKMLWRLVYKEDFPAGKKFEEKSNRELNGRLKFKFDAGNFYFPISFEDDDAKLINFIKDENSYAKLKEDLKDFKLVIIKIGDKESPLLIDDCELEGALLEFFELEPK